MIKALLVEGAVWARDKLRTLAQRVALRRLGASMGRHMEIRVGRFDWISLGANVRFGYGNTVSVELEHADTPAGRRELVPHLHIGTDTTFMEYCNIRAGGGEIRIGSGCLFAQFVSVIASNHAMVPGVPIRRSGADPARTGVRIGDDVWVGAGVVILPGADIGDGCVIGSNSVVTGPLPPYSIAVGIPARVIKQRPA